MKRIYLSLQRICRVDRVIVSENLRSSESFNIIEKKNEFSLKHIWPMFVVDTAKHSRDYWIS